MLVHSPALAAKFHRIIVITRGFDPQNLRAIRGGTANMNETEIEDNILAKTRNVALDIQATSHMMASYKAGEVEWTCKCVACQYVRQSPRIVDAIARAIVKNGR